MSPPARSVGVSRLLDAARGAKVTRRNARYLRVRCVVYEAYDHSGVDATRERRRDPGARAAPGGGVAAILAPQHRVGPLLELNRSVLRQQRPAEEAFMTQTVLVTGGTGRLGRYVVRRLVDAGCNVHVLARRQRDIPLGVAFFTGDLRKAEGIDPALKGVDAIIHCATSTKGDADATRNLVTAAARIGSPHFLYPSIVGIDQIATWGYPKQKLEAEGIVERSGLPSTILRVTQFYDYCFENSRRLARFPVAAPVPAGFSVQPIDSEEVAGRLVELALGESVGRAADMAGPQALSWAALFRSYLSASHRRRLVVPVRIPGSKAVRRGALLPTPGHTTGTKTWEQFLTERLEDQDTKAA